MTRGTHGIKTAIFSSYLPAFLPPKLRASFAYLPNYLLTYLLTYLITHPMEQSPSSEANRYSVMMLSVFYGIRKFITAIKSARHLSLSWAR
jgi:hypothetical protein